ncbi:MAG: histidine kinase dimerization/phosphoacceptor domain -containing protein [Cyclobacteriaceae bacterium]
MFSFLIILLLNLPQPDTLKVMAAPGSSDAFPEVFKPVDSLHFDNPNQSYWVKIDVNMSNGRYILQGGNWYMQSIQFFDSKMKKLGNGNHITISLEDSSTTFYLFYPFHDTKDPDNFTISLFEVEEFLKKKFTKDVFQMGFHSILIFVLFVTVFFIIRSKDVVYRHYAYYIGSILIFFSYQYGLLGNVNSFIRLISPSWMWIFSASLSYAYTLFARSFLDMKEKDPFNYKWSGYALRYIIIIVCIESVSVVFDYDILHKVWYKVLLIIFELGLMSVFLYRIVKMNTPISNIFMIGSFVLLLTTMTGQVASTFKVAYETNTFVQIGLLLDIFILSIGIAVRVNIIQKSRREAQEKLIEQLQLNEKFQQDYLDKLEVDVSSRTADLAQRNLENVTLLKEVHHRVKNNLQMITSMLNMQQRRLKTKEAKEALGLTKNRVKSIGLIHEHLYRHDDFSKIDLNEYVSELTDMLIHSLHKGSEVNVSVNIKAPKVGIEPAISIGLILNELITNSIKYAFENEKNPTLRIEIFEESQTLNIHVIDNGPGINEEKNQTGFGHSIINTLLDSMSGSIEYKNLPGGFHTLIKIEEYQL